ncbi:YpoC family protein [Bacillus sp. AK128]
MVEQVYVNVPPVFLHPLFFSDSENTIEVPLENKRLSITELIKFPFVYDILYHLKMDSYKPWEDRKRAVDEVIRQWGDHSSKVRELFNLRQREEAKPLMIQSIAYYLLALAWTNNYPLESLVHWKEECNRYKTQPVNGAERLEYIINNPDHYHSFLQLTELFEELNKQFQLSIIKQKNSPRP